MNSSRSNNDGKNSRPISEEKNISTPVDRSGGGSHSNTNSRTKTAGIASHSPSREPVASSIIEDISIPAAAEAKSTSNNLLTQMNRAVTGDIDTKGNNNDNDGGDGKIHY